MLSVGCISCLLDVPDRPRGAAAQRCGRLQPTAAGCEVDPGVMQDLSHRGGHDRVTELDEFAVHPPVPPHRVVHRDANHGLADRGRDARPPGTSAARLVPHACDQHQWPDAQRSWGHREHLATPVAGN